MRCAFGKDRYRLGTRHGGAEIIDLTANTRPIFAVNEDSVVNLAEPTNQRPAFNAIIGYESATSDARHDWYIDPAVMVCRVKNIGAQAGACRCGRDATGPTYRQKEQAWPR